MSNPLELSEVDPIDLNGSIDAASELQLAHGSDSLGDHDQTIHAEHSDLENSSGVVQIRVFDFSGGGSSWTIAVEHDPGTGTVTWSRGTNHAYFDFGPMSEEQVIDVTASDGSSPPTTKSRRISIKVTPPDAQPDRPPA